MLTDHTIEFREHTLYTLTLKMKRLKIKTEIQNVQYYMFLLKSHMVYVLLYKLLK